MNKEQKKILISHPTGNANVRAILKGLAKRNILGEFHTSIAVKNNGISSYISKLPPFAELKKRTYKDVPSNYIKTHSLLELGRLLSNKFRLLNFIEHENGVFSIDRVYKDLDIKVSKRVKEFDAVYAYEDGALETFKEAKKNNKICLYDLPIGYWRSMRKLLAQEMENRPDWAPTLTGFKDSKLKVERKDLEIQNSDIIFVASSFTKKTLEDYPGDLPEVKVIPYGFPPVYDDRVYNTKKEKLDLLFVGGLSQRKGIANVLEAAEVLKDQVNLKLIGRKSVENCDALNKSVANSNWVPAMPHDKILEEMRKADILVFPSLFEGYGLVITEAMSQGTPVITTNRTCGADYITDGVNGWIVKPGSTKDLISKIQNIFENKSLLADIGKNAMETAEKFPMDEYGEMMCAKINNLLE